MASVTRYKGYRYPIEVIGHAVWLYHCFALSLRDVEQLMLARGVIVTYETIRCWCVKFGPDYANQLRARVTKTNALESLVIAGFVRGLSVRDVEAALAEALGPQATVSKSTVSRICTQIKTQFEAFSQRRLDDVELDYLFLDGSHFKYHVGAAAEPVLGAWGIDTDGNLIFS